MDLGLYIHVPFCLKKCNYCDFVSYPFDEGAQRVFAGALALEMELRGRLLEQGNCTVGSVYVGGGTPTCLHQSYLTDILRQLFLTFNVRPGAEITVEANPGTVDRGKLEALHRFGVNRLSIGVQSCQPELLKTLGRIHSCPEAVMAFSQARQAGFDNINADLIFGIPGQGLDKWRSCLETVADLKPEHISAYGLHLEEGTPLYERVNSGTVEACPEDLEAEMYITLMDILAARGFVHYEISNFALPGRQCSHNLLYWHNRSFLGLGPSAHSCLGGRRFSNEPELTQYAARLSGGAAPECWEEPGDRRKEMSETAFLGLRLIEGLDTGAFWERFGNTPEEVYPKQIERLENLGLLEKQGGRLRLTRRGLLLGNTVFAEFV